MNKSTILAGMSTAKPHGIPESGGSPESSGIGGADNRGPWPKVAQLWGVRCR